MGKKTQYTIVTPLPPGIPRQLAVDMLHSHGEILELNPLVIEHHPIKAPKNAAADEYFAVWHEITERIQYIPGMGRMASGKISFKGVFHDMPWGLQTHVYAPAGVDLRNKWQIKGNQPGEPREPRELGDKAPADGLYLQEDIEIVCNVTLTPFVKKNLKAASAVLVARLLKKAELLDAGQLQAMFENGRLRTVNPTVASHFASLGTGKDPQLPSQMALGPGQTPYSPHALAPRDSVRKTYYNNAANDQPPPPLPLRPPVFLLHHHPAAPAPNRLRDARFLPLRQPTASTKPRLPTKPIQQPLQHHVRAIWLVAAPSKLLRQCESTQGRPRRLRIQQHDGVGTAGPIWWRVSPTAVDGFAWSHIGAQPGQV